MDCLQNQYRDDGARSREREARLVDELEALRVQIVEKDGQVAALTLENEVVRASAVQAYTRGREEGASFIVTAFKNSHKYAVELSRHGSSFYIDGFATCLEQFKNLGNLPPDFDLSFVNVRAHGSGHIRGEGSSGNGVQIISLGYAGFGFPSVDVTPLEDFQVVPYYVGGSF
ncbi:hypothetical protein Salat_2089800 [Sesamum alatum]|uniref:Uncharacterized protein n=1 Tax=Sesamum alatum TaxID=300844 RepID=A0AAE1Y1L8_9LAMI|nr:hypothetical protein Salat_2089800 [Sesamum alatum]